MIWFAFILLSLLSPQVAEASWSESAFDWKTNRFDRSPVLFSDGNIASVWASVHLHNPFRPGASTEYLQVTAPEFRRGSLRVSASLKRGVPRRKEDRLGQILKAPLIVVLPGIFSDEVSAFSSRALAIFSRLGYHVVLLPSPWVHSYVSRNPKHRPGSVRAEALTVLSMVESLKKYIGYQNITKTELIGASYGALLSSAVYQIDHDGTRPSTFDSGATFLSPPIDLIRGARRIDKLAEREQERFERECKDSSNMIEIILSILKSFRQRDLSSNAIRCAASYIPFLGFRPGLRTALIEVNRYAARSFIPDADSQPEEFKRWEKVVTFEDAVNLTLQSGNAEQIQKEAALSFWINSTAEPFRSRTRILTTRDDFLNLPEEWMQSFDSEYLSKSFLELNWGGHLGYILLDDIQDLLRITFKPNSSSLCK